MDELARKDKAIGGTTSPPPPPPPYTHPLPPPTHGLAAAITIILFLEVNPRPLRKTNQYDPIRR